MRQLRRLIAWVLVITVLCSFPVNALALEPTLKVSESYRGSKYFSQLAAVDTASGNQRDIFVEVAESQVGYHESNSASELSGTSTGGGNYTEYGRALGVNGLPWCAIFVSWCARQAGVDAIKTSTTAGPFSNNVYAWSDVANGRYTPRAGDIVTYKWASAGSAITYSHVGILSSCIRNSDGSFKLTVIEGNANNDVAKKLRTVEASGKIRGGNIGKIVNIGVPGFQEYLPGENDPDVKPTLSISGQTLPDSLGIGKFFGLRGVVTTDYGMITEIRGSILNAQGNEVQNAVVYPNAKSNNLRYSINNGLLFNKLPQGAYVYKVTARAVNGEHEDTKTLIEQVFTVGNADASAIQKPTPAPTYAEKPVISISAQTTPDKLAVGANFGIRGIVSTSCGVLTEVKGMILSESGAVVQSGVYTPNAANHDLRYSINNDLIFNYLADGIYTYRVTAKAVNENQVTETTLIDHSFYVGNGGTVQPVVPDQGSAPNISLTGQALPGALRVGANFGIRGVVSVDKGVIISVYGAIMDVEGKTVYQEKFYYPNTQSHDLRYSINNDLIFNDLSAGTYLYRVEVKAANGDQTSEARLIDHIFTVG